MEKIRRAKKGKRIAGVCTGLARAFGVDVSYMRLAWLAMALVPPFNHTIVVLVYAGLALALPQENGDEEVIDV